MVRYRGAPERRAEIIRRLGEHGYLSSRHAAAVLEVSEMTIRRDLARLEAEGAVRRVPGGAALAGTPTAENFDRRAEREQAPKLAIARAAVANLGQVETVALDAGTTVAPAAALLPTGLRVVSHSLPVLTACEDRDDLEVIGLGGTYQHQTRSFGGPQTRRAAEELAVDVALLSAVAIGDDGFYCTVAWEAEMKQVLHARARRTLVLADHTKACLQAPLRFLPWAEVDTVVTDRGIDPGRAHAWRDRHITVVVAE